MKFVGEIVSMIWPVVKYFTHFLEILTLTFDLDPTSALGSLNVPYLVHNRKSVGEIASKIWPDV